MMKTILFAALMSVCSLGHAAMPTVVFDGAISSVTVASVSLSSSAATLISKPITTTKPALGLPPVTWSSLTLFNVTASSAVYAFSDSATVAPVPALSCSGVGAPIGTGTQAAPWSVTEKFIGFYLWGLSCASDAALPIRVIYRGH